MSYQVKFYNFTKRSNSTKVPSSGNVDYNCVIKNGSGIMTPKVELDLGLAADPSQYNYCYIPNFERYYYVTEWYFDRGLWTASCKVDVLASFKSAIGASSLYVLRASNAYDGRIVDTLYPLKVNCTYQHNSTLSPFKSSGTYVLGVVSPDGDYGSMSYYAVNASGLATICNYLISSAVSQGNGFDLNDASMALQSSLIDPIQYIKSCTYFPFDMTDFGITMASTSIKVFMWTIPSVFCAKITSQNISITKNIPYQDHPNKAARGDYLNTAPYTIATLYAPPFPVIDLDTTVLCDAGQVNLDLAVDPISGKGVLRVWANGGTTLNRLETQIGVPIQLSQVTRDWLGAATSTLSAVGNIVGSAMGGSISGAISGVANGIESAARALTPRSQSLGPGGGFIDIRPLAWTLDQQFFTPVDDDINENGRPLCQVRQISALGGYMLIQDGDVAISGTKAEADEIRSLLESGFYYE